MDNYNNDYFAHHGAHGMWAQNILITYLESGVCFVSTGHVLSMWSMVRNVKFTHIRVNKLLIDQKKPLFPSPAERT